MPSLVVRLLTFGAFILQLDGHYVWLDTHSSSSSGGGISLCGGAHADTKMGTLVDVIIPHKQDRCELLLCVAFL